MICFRFAENGRKFSHDKFIVFENKEYTYLEVDEWSNRCARAFRKLGLHSGNTVMYKNVEFCDECLYFNLGLKQKISFFE